MLGERWMPLYSMVTFSTIPYAEAMRRAKEQDRLLDTVGLDVVEGAIDEGKERVEAALWGGAPEAGN
jgi:hypothetical protein